MCFAIDAKPMEDSLDAYFKLFVTSLNSLIPELSDTVTVNEKEHSVIIKTKENDKAICLKVDLFYKNEHIFEQISQQESDFSGDSYHELSDFSKQFFATPEICISTMAFLNE